MKGNDSRREESNQAPAQVQLHRGPQNVMDKATAQKALPKVEKQKLKEEAEKLQQEFGYCMLDWTL